MLVVGVVYDLTVIISLRGHGRPIRPPSIFGVLVIVVLAHLEMVSIAAVVYNPREGNMFFFFFKPNRHSGTQNAP